MNAFVFTDKALAKHAGQFVWLSIDTENPVNAGLLEKIPTDFLPCYFIIDPATEKPALRWLGTATVEQIEGVLMDVRAQGSSRRPLARRRDRPARARGAQFVGGPFASVHRG